MPSIHRSPPPSFLRTELEHFRVSDSLGQRNGVNVWTVGVVFPFGHAETRPARVVTKPNAPAAMVQREEPAPPPMAASNSSAPT